MNLNEIKDLMAQFDQSSLREFSYKNGTDELQFSKNEARIASEAPAQVAPVPTAVAASPVVSAPSTPVESSVEEAPAPAETTVAPEGDVVESPLVGVAYLAAGPDKPAFVTVGDSVKDWYASNDRYSRNQRSSTPSLPYAPSGSCLGSERRYHCCH